LRSAKANNPAAVAGITSGDAIISVDGAAVRDARELARKIATMDVLLRCREPFGAIKRLMHRSEQSRTR
jgi:C-terminal processing protease CtpA/Prc